MEDAKDCLPFNDCMSSCRRLVSGIRSLVVVTSLRHEIHREIVCKASMLKGFEKISPRSQYLRSFLANGQIAYAYSLNCARQYQEHPALLIQTTWRRYQRYQRKLKEQEFIRKIRRSRGMGKFELAARTMQRLYRGHRVRKCIQNGTLGAIRVFISKMKRLHSLRLEYTTEVRKISEALSYNTAELERMQEAVVVTQAHMEKDMESEDELLDAVLVNGEHVRMQAGKLYARQCQDIDTLRKNCAKFCSALDEIKSSHPAAHFAATIIRARYLSFKFTKARKEAIRDRKRQLMRRILSEEECYQRMNEALNKRLGALHEEMALKVVTLYHIRRAKAVAQGYRENRAARTIGSFYLKIRARMHAKQRCRWLRIKREARRKRYSKLLQVAHKVWTAWNWFVKCEIERRRRIHDALQNGQLQWILRYVLYLQRWIRQSIILRTKKANSLTDELHVRVLEIVAVASEKRTPRNSTKKDIYVNFYKAIECEIKSWHEPTPCIYQLARKYQIPMAILPQQQMYEWLDTSSPFQERQPAFLDVEKPFTNRALNQLGLLSSWFMAHDQVEKDQQLLWTKYETLNLVRSYLHQLFISDKVRSFPSFKSVLPKDASKAAQILSRTMKSEYLYLNVPDDAHAHMRFPWRYVVSLGSSNVKGNLFTSFHCTFKDLCSNCLMLRANNAIACERCDFHHYEESTKVQPSHADRTQPLPSESTIERLFCPYERCDLLVVHAYLHVICPPDSEARMLYSSFDLWEVALAQAYPALSLLYSKGITTLNDLLETLESSPPFPPQVMEKLFDFHHVLTNELRRVEVEI